MKPAPSDPPTIHRQLWDGFTGETGWDVGANCGQTIPEMQRRFTHVTAFEPAEECRPFLSRLTDVIFRPYAISDVDGLIDLIALPDKIDTGQLITPGTHGMEWDPDHPDRHVRQVQAHTLDSVAARAQPPDFCKVDVEGHELHVLRGATHLIAGDFGQPPPQWLIEFHTRDLHAACRDLLTVAGYSVTTVRHPHYPPGSDMWFTHGWIRAFPA